MPDPAPYTGTITVPKWCPASVNVGRGRHWSKAHKARVEAINLLIVYGQSVKKVTDVYRPKRRVELTVVKSGRFPDSHNLLKYFLDALKGGAFLVDDSDEWCECPPPKILRAGADHHGSPRTLVTLTDIPVRPVHTLVGADF